MKKEYEKPIVEVIIFTEDIHTSEDAAGSVDVGGWWE